MEKVLVTGSAGFIGFHLVQKLLSERFEVVGIDNINDYYDVNLKYARLAETGIFSEEETDFTTGKYRNFPRMEFNKPITSTNAKNYRFIRMNLEDKPNILHLFETEKFDYVVHLAAQAGVRYSMENPDIYIQSNIVGFLNILEACRLFPIKHFVYASSSSVYGNSLAIPFTTNDPVNQPVSLYAATKKSNELMAYTYSHLYKIPTTGLRYFTVYGPWGRPDMAIMLFTKAILAKKPIKVFNNGELERDFTFIDNIVEGTAKVLLTPPEKGHEYRVFNIGNGKPIQLDKFITELESIIGIRAIRQNLPMQPGDVEKTWADTSELEKLIKYRPDSDLNSSISTFFEWYKGFYL